MAHLIVSNETATYSSMMRREIKVDTSVLSHLFTSRVWMKWLCLEFSSFDIPLKGMYRKVECYLNQISFTWIQKC